MRKFTVILILISFVVFTGFTIQNDESLRIISQPLDKFQTQLQSQELNNPLQYLKVDTKIKANLILLKGASVLNDAQYVSDGYLVEGVIKNYASFSSFKSVLLRVDFHSIDDNRVVSKYYSFPKNYKPKSDTPILFKVYPPKGGIEFDFEIVSASGV